MKLVIGLGNPGKKYEHTRHNIGFRALDELAKSYGLEFELKKKLNVEIARLPSPLAQASGGQAKKRQIILAKPQTFMNESGESARRMIKDYRLSNIDLIVVHDDIDLPLGETRLSADSGSAGHHGASSIIERVGKDVSRLRIGIENRSAYRVPETDVYVLQRFTPSEEKQISGKIIPEAVEKIEQWLSKK